MKKLLGQVDLRNVYRVYEDGRFYLVTSVNPRKPGSQRHECRVHPEAVSYLRNRMAGRHVTAEQAGDALEPVAERFKLPYTYGDKLRYSGQYVLIAAVALGQATVTKEGRSYVYSIK